TVITRPDAAANPAMRSPSCSDPVRRVAELESTSRTHTKHETPMSQNETLHLAQEFLGRMGSGAAPTEIAKLFSETLEWEIAGDAGVLPWIGHKSGRAAITDFVRDSRAMIERISFEVHDILASDNRAVILGSLASKLKRNGKVVTTDFAIVLTVANGE